MKPQILLVLGILAVLLVSGCTQQPKDFDLKIVSVERGFGDACGPNPGNVNYLKVFVKNDGQRWATYNDNEFMFCGKNITLNKDYFNCDNTYWLCRVKDMLVGGQYDNLYSSIQPNETTEFYLTVTLPSDLVHNSTALCGRTLDVNLVGRDFPKTATSPRGIFQPNIATQEKQPPFIVDSKSVIISC